jgi:putative ABC transport system permease protein
LRETRLILRDLRGSRFRTTAVVIAAAVLVSLLFSSSALQVGARRASLAGSEKFGADMMLLSPITPTLFSYEQATGPLFVVDGPEGYLNSSLVSETLRLPGVEAASPQIFVANLNRSSSGLSPGLVAFDPKTDFVIKAWFDGSIVDLGYNQALAGPGAGMSVGDQISYSGLNLKVVALLHATNASLDRTILFPIQALYSQANAGGVNLTGGRGVSAVMVKLAPDAALSSVEVEIKNRLGSLRLREANALVQRVTVDTTGIGSYELLAETIMAASVFSMMGLVFSMTTNERGRQLGLLRSLGATRRFIFSNVLKEAALMAIAGSIVGIVLGEALVTLGEGFLLATFNTTLVGPNFSELLILIGGSAALGVVTGTAASVLPAYKVTRRDPYEAIRYGE